MYCKATERAVKTEIQPAAHPVQPVFFSPLAAEIGTQLFE